MSDAARLYVLERGSVVESGSHADLLSDGGLYAQFCQMQLDDGLELSTDATATEA